MTKMKTLLVLALFLMAASLHPIRSTTLSAQTTTTNKNFLPSFEGKTQSEPTSLIACGPGYRFEGKRFWVKVYSDPVERWEEVGGVAADGLTEGPTILVTRLDLMDQFLLVWYIATDGEPFEGAGPMALQWAIFDMCGGDDPQGVPT